MKIRLLVSALCVALSANAGLALADPGAGPAGAVPPRNPSAALADESFDFSEVVNFMFFLQSLNRFYAISADAEDPIEVNPISIAYGSDDDPDAFDVAFNFSY